MKTHLQRIDEAIDKHFYAVWAAEERQAIRHARQAQIEWYQTTVEKVPVGEWIYSILKVPFGISRGENNGWWKIQTNAGMSDCKLGVPCFRNSRDGAAVCDCAVCGQVRERKEFLAKEGI